MIIRSQYCDALASALVGLVMLIADAVLGQAPPVLDTVFPAGGQVGQSVEVTVSGSNLQGLRTLHCNVSRRPLRAVGAEPLSADDSGRYAAGTL